MFNKLASDKESSTLVGLDIGKNSCKFVELHYSRGHYQLINWATETVAAGDLPKTIQKILTKLRKPHNAPTTAVSGKGTLNRFIEMPRMSLDDLKQSFSLEADKYFPFPSDQIYTDCYILDTKSKESKMSVMVVAAKKEIIDERIQILAGLGLQVDSICLNSIAIANVLNVLGSDHLTDSQAPGDHSAVAILDMGEMVSNLTILINDLPRFTRDIFVGGCDFTKSISNALSLNFLEAETLKRQPQEKMKEVMNACETTLMNVISELRLSFDYFVTEKGVMISKLLLAGGASALSGVEDVFLKHLDIPIARWDPTQRIEVAEDVSKEELHKNGAQLGVALGLALYHA